MKNSIFFKSHSFIIILLCAHLFFPPQVEARNIIHTVFYWFYGKINSNVPVSGGVARYNINEHTLGRMLSRGDFDPDELQKVMYRRDEAIKEELKKRGLKGAELQDELDNVIDREGHQRLVKELSKTWTEGPPEHRDNLFRIGLIYNRGVDRAAALQAYHIAKGYNVKPKDLNKWIKAETGVGTFTGKKKRKLIMQDRLTRAQDYIAAFVRDNDGLLPTTTEVDQALQAGLDIKFTMTPTVDLTFGGATRNARWLTHPKPSPAGSSVSSGKRTGNPQSGPQPPAPPPPPGSGTPPPPPWPDDPALEQGKKGDRFAGRGGSRSSGGLGGILRRNKKRGAFVPGGFPGYPPGGFPGYPPGGLGLGLGGVPVPRGGAPGRFPGGMPSYYPPGSLSLGPGGRSIYPPGGLIPTRVRVPGTGPVAGGKFKGFAASGGDPHGLGALLGVRGGGKGTAGFN